MVLFTYMATHVILKKITDRPDISSELFNYDEYSTIPLFNDITNPPYPFYPIHMSNYQYNRLKEEIIMKQNFQRRMEEIYTPEQKQEPDVNQLRSIQLVYNNFLALLAVEERWTTAQTKAAREEMQVFLAQE